MNKGSKSILFEKFISPITQFVSQTYLRFRTTEHTFMVIMAVIIGLVGGFGAVGIQYSIKLIQRIFWGTWDFSLDYVTELPIYVKIFVPAIGGLFVGIIVYYV
ncbi:MAG: hypothetical protein ACE5GL_11680, partial [Calditrichia bacterium]